MIEVKFVKTHPDAQLPKRSHESYVRTEGVGLVQLITGDTGYDVFSVEDVVIKSRGSSVVKTGIDVAFVDPGYWFLVLPRSGLGFKYGLQPHIGVIDNSFRGNCSVKLYNFSEEDYTIRKGDRIAQLVFYPLIEANIEWAESISPTNRGEKGFGSTGK